jgi:putative membrane protein
MHPALESLVNGFPQLVIYLLLVTAIYLVGLIVYVKLTPHKEIELIQQGNMAAAISFSGLVIGLALPLAACLVYRVGLVDVLVWGVVSVLLQLFLFRMTDMVLSGLPKRIVDDEVPAATVLASFKLAGSIILAVAIVG